MKSLIITTPADNSKELILQAFKTADCLYYDQSRDQVNRVLVDNRYDVVYYRDPFNQGSFDAPSIRQTVEYIFRICTDALFVDGVKTYQDLLFEDKWRQYQLFSDVMPETKLIDFNTGIKEGSEVAKERISSRAKGVVFDNDSVDIDKQYIVQKIIDIDKELRVFVVDGAILPLAAVRSSKTADTKVKMIETEVISSEIIKFAQSIYDKISYMNFVGLDIVIQPGGRPMLIEVNRSPQFSRYNEMTGTNLAELLMKGLS